MHRGVFRILVALFLTAWIQAQQVPTTPPGGEVVGLSSKQLAQRIFTGEQISIAQFSKREPIVESYVQSLDPEVSPEAVVDDAYFLGRVYQPRPAQPRA